MALYMKANTVNTLICGHSNGKGVFFVTKGGSR